MPYLNTTAIAAYNVGYVLLAQASVQPRNLIQSYIIFSCVALTALRYGARSSADPFASAFVLHLVVARILPRTKTNDTLATLACGLFGSVTSREFSGMFPPQDLGASSLQAGTELFSLSPATTLIVCIMMLVFGAAYLVATMTARLRHKENQVRYLLACNQSLLEHPGDRICVVGADYRIRFINDRERAFIEDSDGPNCYAALWGEERPCRECPLPQVIENGQAITRSGEDHEGRIYERVYSPFPVRQNIPLVIVKWRDITQRTRQQQAIAFSEKLAVLGELTAGLAHDIGNLLHGCHQAVATLRRRVSPSIEVHTILELMEQGLQRIDSIVRCYLGMARPDGLHYRHVHVPEVIESALLFLDSRITRRNISVDRDWPSSLPPLQVDPDALCQVLTNVLLNAVDAVEGPGWIGITVRYKEHKGTGRMEIRIADSGCGISAQHLERIFEPFFTTKPDGKGTGLGLAIARRLIHKHAGDIYVHSAAGVGSIVVISLPVEADNNFTMKEETYGHGNHSDC